MSREIKFRGLTINGQWHIGNLAVATQNIDHVKKGSYISNSVGVPFAYQIRPESVGAFTGLLDKNGKEIYEGDILYGGGNLYSAAEWNADEAQFFVVPGITTPNYPLSNHHMALTICGNIHETPDLLNAKT